MATTRLMPLHIGEGRSFSTAIEDIIDYVENPEKTDYGKLIYGFECDTRTADAEFTLAKRQYIHQTGRVRGADDVIAYHFRQAFKPGEVTPEEANQIGQELAMRLTKGNNAFIVCTHIDKHHVHNHIIVSAVNLECTKKFRNFWGSSWALRRISDKLCLEHGLSIVEDPKPSRSHYGKWLGDGNKPLSFQNQIRQAIDAALEQSPSTFEDFLKILEASGVEVTRRGKSVNFRVSGQKKPTRCNTLKGGYTEPVSYTHLDVYKRQGLYITKTILDHHEIIHNMVNTENGVKFTEMCIRDSCNTLSILNLLMKICCHCLIILKIETILKLSLIHI